MSWDGRTRRRGNGIIVDHGAGVFSGYYHLSEVLQTGGAVVEQGDLIGRMGATGLATGPHLHWEVVVRGVTVNPLPWLRLLEFPDPRQELNSSECAAGDQSRVGLSIADCGALTRSSLHASEDEAGVLASEAE